MAGETTITIIGNLTNDPELRFTPSGQAVANFTIASTPREFDRQNNAWKDGETLFMRATVWRDAAENVVETLAKGMRVIASGRMKSRSYETKEGEKRTVIELEVDEIGPSLRYANAKVNRTQRNGQGQGNNAQDYAPAQGGYNQQSSGQWGNQPQGQPQGGQWGGQPQQQGGFGGGFGGGPYAQAQTASGQQQNAAMNQQQGGFGGPYQPQPDDPWATPGVSNTGGWGNGPQNEPPF